jgi:hypothetical protein
MSPIRASSHFISAAAFETRIVFFKAPKFIRHFVTIAIWAFVAVSLGFIVGFSSVILPPTGAFGIVAAIGLVLLWAMPDFPIAPLKKMRVIYFIFLVVFLCVPNYYTVQVSALPWISAHRISLFPLIMLFALSLSMSSKIRGDIVRVMSANRWVATGLIGFGVMILLSLLTSISFSSSLSSATDAALEWFLPFFITLYVVRSDADVEKVVKIIGLCAVLVCSIGIADFVLQRRLALEAMPHGLLERLMESNLSVMRMVNSSPFRNGIYRASSIFGESNSFGEFAIIVLPIGIFFAFCRDNLRGRVFGYCLIFVCVAAVFCSGARGGYFSIATGTASFIGLWYARSRKLTPNSLAPMIVVVIACILFTLATVAVIFWPRAHNLVLGDGAAASSTDARFQQWELAKPHIIANPITGHGFSLGAEVIANGNEALGYTIDSYPLSLVVETGVPSLVFFCMAAFGAIWYGSKRYLADPSVYGSLSGALACAVVTFTTFRLVLSQRENHTLFFLLLSLIAVSRTNHLLSIVRSTGHKPAVSRKKSTAPYFEHV